MTLTERFNKLVRAYEALEAENVRYREALTYISRWLNDDLTKPPTDDRDVRAIVNIARTALSGEGERP